MTEKGALPNVPVIVMHLDNGHGLTMCSGHPLPRISEQYNKVPRLLCPLCARILRDAGDRNIGRVKRVATEAARVLAPVFAAQWWTWGEEVPTEAEIDTRLTQMLRYAHSTGKRVQSGPVIVERTGDELRVLLEVARA